MHNYVVHIFTKDIKLIQLLNQIYLKEISFLEAFLKDSVRANYTLLELERRDDCRLSVAFNTECSIDEDVFSKIYSAYDPKLITVYAVVERDSDIDKIFVFEDGRWSVLDFADNSTQDDI